MRENKSSGWESRLTLSWSKSKSILGGFQQIRLTASNFSMERWVAGMALLLVSLLTYFLMIYQVESGSSAGLHSWVECKKWSFRFLRHCSCTFLGCLDCYPVVWPGIKWHGMWRLHTAWEGRVTELLAATTPTFHRCATFACIVICLWWFCFYYSCDLVLFFFFFCSVFSNYLIKTSLSSFRLYSTTHKK